MVSDTDFEQLLEEHFYSYKTGSLVRGTVIGWEGNNVLVDINTKTSAICPEYEIVLNKGQNPKELFEIGETYDFIINSPENEDGVFYLSHRKVAILKNLEIIKEKFQNDEILEGTVTNITKGGILVNVMGIKGFVPTSHLKVTQIAPKDKIELKVLSIDLDNNNFILSNKKVYSDSMENVKKEILDKIELNMVVKGRVVRITDFGAFVDIGGIDGLLPLSQISWKWIDNPSDILKLDDKIDVEIIGIDKDKQRVSLSLKSLEENPWLKAEEFIQDKKILKGKVTGVKTFGAFIEIYPKVEGLINKAQISQYTSKTKKELKEDDEIDVIIKRFDAQNQKINLEISYDEN